MFCPLYPHLIPKDETNRKQSHPVPRCGPCGLPAPCGAGPDDPSVPAPQTLTASLRVSPRALFQPAPLPTLYLESRSGALAISQNKGTGSVQGQCEAPGPLSPSSLLHHEQLSFDVLAFNMSWPKHAARIKQRRPREQHEMAENRAQRAGSRGSQTARDPELQELSF